MTRIGIIKLGLSETLDDSDGGLSPGPSLGDVLRTTPLVPALAEMHAQPVVTWITTPQAAPLLAGAPGIHRLALWSGRPEDAASLSGLGPFELLINLEKTNAACELAEGLRARERLGFYRRKGQVACREYYGGGEVMHYLAARKNGGPRRPWQGLILGMVGASWRGQPYVLPWAAPEPRFDVGLNFAVGEKWPTKAMPLHRWRGLAQNLAAAGLKVSWQQGRRDLGRYLDWVGSCRLLVTQDSLGLHVALALGRRVVGLFGPTSPQEVYGYGRASFLSAPSDCPKLPCYEGRCPAPRPCMERLDLERVARAVLADLSPIERERS